MESLTEKKFSEIVEAHADAIFSLSRHILRNKEDAEDAVQETFLKVYRHYHQFEASRSLKNWITAITVNCCCDILRKRKSSPSGEPMDPERFPDKKQGRDKEDAALIVEEVLDRLNPEHRIALLLFYMEGKSIKEIAKIQGIPQVVVKVRLYRARKAAQKILMEM